MCACGGFQDVRKKQAFRIQCGKGNTLGFVERICYGRIQCLQRERNNRGVEDLERTLEDILFSIFHTYLWTTAYVSPLLISFDDFLFCFSLSSQVIHFVYFWYTQGCFTLLIKEIITYIKKRRNGFKHRMIGSSTVISFLVFLNLPHVILFKSLLY